MSGARTSLGYVPQKVLLDPDIPIRARDLVALGLDAQRYGFGRRTKGQRELVDKMLHDVDAERLRRRSGREHSREGSSSGY